uniref:Putative ovule protein n=1 Tax=Solanum chacoense TaxID=4108 RepID=A0A0V0GRT0_SOLCH
MHTFSGIASACTPGKSPPKLSDLQHFAEQKELYLCKCGVHENSHFLLLDNFAESFSFPLFV